MWESDKIEAKKARVERNKAWQVSQGSICEGWKHGMAFVDSCLFTWITHWWLWLWRLPWLYCNDVFFWIIHGGGFFWRLSFSLNEGFLGYILCHILWVCFLFYCMRISIAYLFQIYYGLCGNCYILCCNFPYIIVGFDVVWYKLKNLNQ